MANREEKVQFQRNLHHEDVYITLQEEALRICGHAGLCGLRNSNIYYNEKSIRLVEVTINLKYNKNDREIQDLMLWFKTTNKSQKSDQLRDLYEIIEMWENVSNIRYIVNEYEVKTDYAIMTFEQNLELCTRCRGVELHFTDK